MEAAETKKIDVCITFWRWETKWLNKVDAENEGERRIKSAIYLDLNNQLVPFTETREINILLLFGRRCWNSWKWIKNFPNKKTSSEGHILTNKYQTWDSNPEF